MAHVLSVWHPCHEALWPLVNWAKLPVLTLGMEPSKLQRLQAGYPNRVSTSGGVWGFDVGHRVGRETPLGDIDYSHSIV